MWLAELAHVRARETPERVAYRWLDWRSDRVTTLTYAALDERARALGAAIAARTTPGARVLLLLPSSLDFVVAAFACLYAARTLVPSPEPQLRRDGAVDERVRALLIDAEPALVIGRARVVQQLARAPWSALVPAGSACATLEDLDAAAEPPRTSSDDALTLLQYTSGSTSAPRGTMITAAALRSNLAQICARFAHAASAEAVFWLPMHHDMGLIGGVLGPMYRGNPVTLMSPLDFVQRPLRWLEAITRYRAMTSGGPAFAYRMCVERIRDAELAALDLSCWETAFVGAERVPASTLRAFAARFAARGFHERAFLPCYGLAECTLMATSRAKGSGLLTDAGAAAHVSCGPPIEGHELRIVDPESARLCAEGEIGEIWLRGPSVGAGYWQRPEQSAHTFGGELEAEGRYLRTGDLGFLRDGELYVTGRLKDTIIVRGVKHAPEDLEATLAAAHPLLGLAPAAAFACSAEHGEDFVIACEVRRSAFGERELEEAKSAALEAIVEAHDVRPRAILWLKPGALPRTTSGKVKRHLCRERFANGDWGTA